MVKKTYHNADRRNIKNYDQNSDSRRRDGQTEQSPRPKARKVEPEVSICTSAMKKFRSLPKELQNTANKRLCIETVLASKKQLYGDSARFWNWVAQEAEKLVRTFDFEEVCEKKNLDPGHVAHHLVLEGRGLCKKIRLDGLAAHSTDVVFFGDELIPEDAVKLLSKHVPSDEKKEVPNE